MLADLDADLAEIDANDAVDLYESGYIESVKRWISESLNSIENSMEDVEELRPKCFITALMILK